ncbi:MAG TPA: SRPBCC domain-containing protein, partial [Turneriella sp.]|nr:SRPBCC domain-containing protein [Turneriella sp.]
KVWTTPENMLEWWGPTFCPAKQVDMDVRPGGKWRCCLDSQVHGGDLWQNGVFREVRPYDLLEFTFVWEAEGDMGVENVVTIRFFDEAGKTRMHFRQAPFTAVSQRDANNGGWSNMFIRLEDYLQKVKQ